MPPARTVRFFEKYKAPGEGRHGGGGGGDQDDSRQDVVSFPE